MEITDIDKVIAEVFDSEMRNIISDCANILNETKILGEQSGDRKGYMRNRKVFLLQDLAEKSNTVANWLSHGCQPVEREDIVSYLSVAVLNGEIGDTETLKSECAQLMKADTVNTFFTKEIAKREDSAKKNIKKQPQTLKECFRKKYDSNHIIRILHEYLDDKEYKTPKFHKAIALLREEGVLDDSNESLLHKLLLAEFGDKMGSRKLLHYYYEERNLQYGENKDKEKMINELGIKRGI